MAPRRSGRRSASAYKKGDYVEYQYKGSTVTGKLLKKSPNGTEANPLWVVTPSDRRRRSENIPEKALGKTIDADEALNNRGPKLRKSSRVARDSSSPTNMSHSDGSLDDERATRKRGDRGSPSEDSSKAGGSDARKRKGDGSNADGGGERARKSRKTVTFSRRPNAAAAPSRKRATKKSKNAKNATRVSTRSSRGSVEAVMLPDLPIRRKKLFKTKKIKKDENVKVVKMLTGTLYLYRGDRPRAEFVRSK